MPEAVNETRTQQLAEARAFLGGKARREAILPGPGDVDQEAGIRFVWRAATRSDRRVGARVGRGDQAALALEGRERRLGAAGRGGRTRATDCIA